MKLRHSLFLFGFLLAGAGAALSADGPRPPAAALDRPAMQTAKAAEVALLAAARAGKRVLAAGERGVVVYSDDDGRSWQQAKTPTSADLTALQFIGGKQGWAVGHMGVVLHTGDGGQNWTKQLDGIAAAQRTLEAARNGGDERAIADAERLVADGADKPFFDILFLDGRTGFIVGAYNLIFRTDDGGASWKPWQAHTAKANPKALHLYGIRAVGKSLFIAGEQGLLLRSDDEGEHFEALASPHAGSWFGLASDGQALVIYGLRGYVYRSADLGKSWQQLNVGTPVSISAGAFLSNGRLVLTSQAGEVLVSADQGASFTRIPGAARLPLAAVAELPGGLVVASLRGVKTLSLSAPKP